MHLLPSEVQTCTVIFTFLVIIIITTLEKVDKLNYFMSIVYLYLVINKLYKYVNNNTPRTLFYSVLNFYFYFLGYSLIFLLFAIFFSNQINFQKLNEKYDFSPPPLVVGLMEICT